MTAAPNNPVLMYQSQLRPHLCSQQSVRVCRWGETHDHVTLSQFAERVAEFKVNFLEHMGQSYTMDSVQQPCDHDAV